VPLHRRGEREAMIWQRFEQAIGSTTATHVCLVDFDDPLFAGASATRARGVAFKS
jgi:hypothetical protein